MEIAFFYGNALLWFVCSVNKAGTAEFDQEIQVGVLWLIAGQLASLRQARRE